MSAQRLGYNEGQVLEPFKNTLLSRYYHLLFGIQNLREEFESAKSYDQGKMDNKLADQSFTHTCPLKHISLQRRKELCLMNTNYYTTKQTE